MTLLELLDYASVFVFALTGALVASRAQLDIVGFAFVAALTATGGGTVRDVVLDRNPVFWIAAPSFVGVAVAAA
ncbi:MAG: TRIC cation channel family protein, partial [Rhodobacteraceae bacterium]|nr:TRIC cation channel family protein [Paracoccaceae bacterium]